MNKSITQSAECAKVLLHGLYGPDAVNDTDEMANKRSGPVTWSCSMNRCGHLGQGGPPE